MTCNHCERSSPTSCSRTKNYQLLVLRQYFTFKTLLLSINPPIFLCSSSKFVNFPQAYHLFRGHLKGLFASSTLLWISDVHQNSFSFFYARSALLMTSHSNFLHYTWYTCISLSIFFQNLYSPRYLHFDKVRKFFLIFCS